MILKFSRNWSEGKTGKGANRILFFGAGNGFKRLVKNRMWLSFGFAELTAIRRFGSGLFFFGSFGCAELVRLMPSSVLLEEQKK